MLYSPKMIQNTVTPKKKLTRREREHRLEEKQNKCDHDYQPKFNSMSESFAFFRCDKCGKIQ